MKLLPRWLLRKFLLSLFLFQAGLFGLFVAVELFELREHYGADPASLAALAEYLALRAPFLVYLSIPVAVVLAVLLVIAARAHASEIVAAEAGGISLLRLSAPILAACFALSALLLAGAEYRVPRWSDRADYLRRVVIQKKFAPRTEYADLVFSVPGAYVSAERFEPSGNVMETVAIVIPRDRHAAADVAARWPRLRFNGSAWQSAGFIGTGTETAPASREDSALLALIPPPRWIELIAPTGGVRVLADKPIEALSVSTLWRESRDIFDLAARQARDRRLLGEAYERLVKIQAKLALPVSLPLLALIGICLGARVGRRQGLGAAIGSALMTSLGFMLLLQTATHLGTFAARSAALQEFAVLFPWLTPVTLALVALVLTRRGRFAQ